MAIDQNPVVIALGCARWGEDADRNICDYVVLNGYWVFLKLSGAEFALNPVADCSLLF